MLSTKKNLPAELSLADFEEVARDLAGREDVGEALHDLVVAWLEGSRKLHSRKQLQQLVWSYLSEARRRERRLKDREKRAFAEQSAKATESETPSDHMELKEYYQFAKESISRLSDGLREVFEGCYVRHKSVAELALERNVTESAIRSQLTKARLALREEFDRKFQGRIQWVGGVALGFSQLRLDAPVAWDGSKPDESPAGPESSAAPSSTEQAGSLIKSYGTALVLVVASVAGFFVLRSAPETPAVETASAAGGSATGGSEDRRTQDFSGSRQRTPVSGVDGTRSKLERVVPLAGANTSLASRNDLAFLDVESHFDHSPISGVRVSAVLERNDTFPHDALLESPEDVEVVAQGPPVAVRIPAGDVYVEIEADGYRPTKMHLQRGQLQLARLLEVVEVRVHLSGSPIDEAIDVVLRDEAGDHTRRSNLVPTNGSVTAMLPQGSWQAVIEPSRQLKRVIRMTHGIHTSELPQALGQARVEITPETRDIDVPIRFQRTPGAVPAEFVVTLPAPPEPGWSSQPLLVVANSEYGSAVQVPIEPDSSGRWSLRKSLVPGTYDAFVFPFLHHERIEITGTQGVLQLDCPAVYSTTLRFGGTEPLPASVSVRPALTLDDHVIALAAPLRILDRSASGWFVEGEYRISPDAALEVFDGAHMETFEVSARESVIDLPATRATRLSVTFMDGGSPVAVHEPPFDLLKLVEGGVEEQPTPEFALGDGGVLILRSRRPWTLELVLMGPGSYRLENIHVRGYLPLPGRTLEIEKDELEEIVIELTRDYGN